MCFASNCHFFEPPIKSEEEMKQQIEDLTSEGAGIDGAFNLASVLN
jgi:hypothetical protein